VIDCIYNVYYTVCLFESARWSFESTRLVAQHGGLGDVPVSSRLGFQESTLVLRVGM